LQLCQLTVIGDSLELLGAGGRSTRFAPHEELVAAVYPDGITCEWGFPTESEKVSACLATLVDTPDPLVFLADGEFRAETWRETVPRAYRVDGDALRLWAPAPEQSLCSLLGAMMGLGSTLDQPNKQCHFKARPSAETRSWRVGSWSRQIPRAIAHLSSLHRVRADTGLRADRGRPQRDHSTLALARV
jgi:hypothetical protein